MKKALRIFKQISPTKINSHLQARKKIKVTERTFIQIKNWKKLSLKERLSLVQKEIENTALKRRAAEDISEISYGREKQNWKKRSNQLNEYERSLRTLAIHYHKKTKRKSSQQ